MKFNKIITTVILRRTRYVTAVNKRFDGRFIPQYSENEADARRFENAQEVIDKIYNTHDLVFTVQKIVKGGKQKVQQPGDELD
jgi:hypothetical protein